jgi:uncharacterized protein (TIGR00369 family)
MENSDPDLNHFLTIPWCRKHLLSSNNKITPTLSRIAKSQNEDSLMAIALNTPSTISHCISLYPIPPPRSTSGSLSKDFLEINSLSTIYQLDTLLNGGPNLLHGGIIATLLDDTIGTLLTVNHTPKGDPLSRQTVTAELKVRYMRPVWTPGTVMCSVRVVRKVGRKVWFEGEVWGDFEDDGKGKKLASVESLWVVVEVVQSKPEHKL